MKEGNLECLVHWLPYIQELVGIDCSISLTCKEKVIGHLNGTEIQQPIKVGDSIKEGSITDAVIKEGRQINKKVGREVFGVPYMGRGVPLKNEKGQIIGVLTATMPITLQEEINSLTSQMNKSLEALEISTSNVAASSQELAATVTSLSQTTEDVKSEMKVMDSIMGLIREISDQTHLLGLNAAIEAARAGEHGRGFNVVAGEIRKLANRTKDSIKQINEKTKKVLESINVIANSIQQIAAASDEQAATSGDISEATCRLKEDSHRMLDLAQNLLSK